MAVTNPTVEQVALHVLARTRGPNSTPGAFGDDELGTFTADTRPTADQVEGFITSAGRLIIPRLGTVPTRLEDMAQEIIALRAAMFVERSLNPEQSTGEDTVYKEIEDEVKSALSDYDMSASTDTEEPGHRIGSVTIGTMLTLPLT